MGKKLGMSQTALFRFLNKQRCLHAVLEAFLWGLLPDQRQGIPY